MDYKILKEKQYTISSHMIKYLDKDLSFIEFLIILYYLNEDEDIFDVNKICNKLNISLDDAMVSFDNLIHKELLEISQGIDSDGKIIDKISLDPIYQKTLNNLKQEEKIEKDENIFDLIESEFDKKLSPSECEIINGWLDDKIPEELIIGALKDAVYNGVKTFRYMDKLLYEWGKKGFKTMDDVNNHLKSKDDSNNNEELFDYDWLDSK